MSRYSCLAIALALLAHPAGAQGLEFPANATRTFNSQTANDSYALPLAPVAQGRLATRQVEGAVTRQAWRIEAVGLTTLQILGPLRDQLGQEGYLPLFECMSWDCGGFDFRLLTEVLAPPEMFVDLGDFRFYAAERPSQSGAAEVVTLLVSRSGAAGYVQLISAGGTAQQAALTATSDTALRASPVAGSDTATQPVDPSTFGAQLERSGRVVLSDLSFQTGSSQLGDGPFASLQALADYLRENPSRHIALVGHTDAEGSLEANIRLSKRRAGSVLERLVSVLGAQRGQVAAEGMGYLAPLTNNLSPEGREANRRVEVILTSTN